MDELKRNIIITNPEIMMGKPIIAGTRITVELVLEKVAEGESIDQILSAHPNLERKQVLAALEYAAMVFKSDVVYPVGA